MKHWHRLPIAGLVMVALAVALALITPSGQGSLAADGIIYVDADATSGTNNGSSWDDAFTTLQPALEAAASGDQIWVAAGAYAPTAEHGGTGDRYRSFQMKNGVAIYGGFDPSVGDVAFEDRDWEANPTILSGDLYGDDGPDFENNGENSYHVFYHPDTVALDSTAMLDGFTVTGGNADGDDPHYRGGGMHNDRSSPALSNCTFSGNSADFPGGGLYNRNSSPVLNNCAFVGNQAYDGGGMYNYNTSSPALSHCTFSGNLAHSLGGGIYNISSSPTLIDCVFSGNSAYSGGGMANWFSSPTLTDCAFSGNSTDDDGGGMYNFSSSPALTNCTLSDNSALDHGGGMENAYSSSPTLANCTFSGNSAGFGGAMRNDSSSPVLTNCTFVNNSADYGGAVRNDSSSPTLTNCTFEDNSTDGHGGGMYNHYHSSPVLTGCTFSGNSAGAMGGGMSNAASSPTLINCTFSGNSGLWGGGMANQDSAPALTNVAFSGNSAYGGGGMANDVSSPALTNCTFEGNSADWGGGGMYNNDRSTPVLTNCILWGDAPDEIYNNEPESSPIVTYSDIERGYDGEGNIDADPLFLDAGAGDLRLQDTSPAIDAGDNDAPGLAGVTTDRVGNPRFVDVIAVVDTGNGDPPIVDMGAYEALPGVSLVDEDATGANDGSSWNNAYTTLQPALDAAVAGDQIWVAAGVYRPTQEYSPGDPRSATFQLKNGVAIYGGFDPSVGHVAFEDRDWEANETILSGDLNGDDGPDFANNDENSYHVFYHPYGLALDGTAVMDGFTITGGNATERGGGGMQNVDSSPTLTNCTFSGNSAAGGGGMENAGTSRPTLANCTFSGNSAAGGGGMANSHNSCPTLTSCTFLENSADHGGGMANFYSYCAPTLTNCIFSGNSADYGGGMYNLESSPTMTNVTFTGNSAASAGGGLYNNSSSPTLTNCVLWGDAPDEINDSGSSAPVVTYSDIQGGCDTIPGNDCGTGNIDANPRFMDLGSGDFHLGPDSPCIDVGNNTAPNLPLYDFEGDDRIIDGDGDGEPVVDMGVDEAFWYPPVYLPLVLKGY